MALIKKIDVDAHFASRRRERLAARGLVGRRVSTGTVVPDPATTKARASEFKSDFSTEHSSSKAPSAPSR